jgi:predicted CoA-binding protein
MKKRLEEFIDQNRDAFDDKVPGEKVWKNIEASLPFSRKSLWNNTSIWRAAAILFMGLSIYMFVPKNAGSRNSGEKMLNEFQDVERFYVQEISEKVQLIDGYERSDGLSGFTKDIDQLEAMYMVLKEQMEASPSQKVKDALVLNLLVRIDLLNQQLHKLDTEYRRGDEPSGTTRKRANA